MNKEQFLAMDENARFDWLKEQSAAGKGINDILAELGMTRAELQVQGYTFAIGEWHMLSMANRQAAGGVSMGGADSKAEGWAKTF